MYIPYGQRYRACEVSDAFVGVTFREFPNRNYHPFDDAAPRDDVSAFTGNNFSCRVNVAVVDGSCQLDYLNVGMDARVPSYAEPVGDRVNQVPIPSGTRTVGNICIRGELLKPLRPPPHRPGACARRSRPAQRGPGACRLPLNASLPAHDAPLRVGLVPEEARASKLARIHVTYHS